MSNANEPNKCIAPIVEVESYLKEIRKIIYKNFDLVPRDKNLKDIARLGLDPVETIRSLTVQDYNRGPLKDDDLNRPTPLWEFIKDIDGVEVYMKIKIENRKSGLCVVCISIHESLGPKTLPYKGSVN